MKTRPLIAQRRAIIDALRYQQTTNRFAARLLESGYARAREYGRELARIDRAIERKQNAKRKRRRNVYDARPGVERGD